MSRGRRHFSPGPPEGIKPLASGRTATTGPRLAVGTTINSEVATGEATRIPVKLGRSSVNQIEITEGLQPGDQVILSDMSAQDAFERNARIKRKLAAALPTNRGLLTKLADYRFQAI